MQGTSSLPVSASLSLLDARLSDVQRGLLDAMWDRLVASGVPYPNRDLPRVIGKRRIEEVMAGVNVPLFVKAQEGGDLCYALTFQGALLSTRGRWLSNVIVRLFDLINALYEEDSFVKQIGDALVKEKLNLTQEESRALFTLMKMAHLRGMPCYLSGWAHDRSSWWLTVTDEVIDLYRAPSSKSFLDELLRAIGEADAPNVINGFSLPSEHLSSFSSFNEISAPLENLAWTSQAYVVQARMTVLRQLNHDKFDCTRLIKLCEELNDCSKRGNAHAIIMLTRAVLDHVSPVFGCRTFREVASSYGQGGKSLKEAFERLEQQSRKVADRLLHMPIRSKEVAPTMKEVDFSPEIEMLLAEFCRVLK